jgi:hypothetical protein
MQSVLEAVAQLTTLTIYCLSGIYTLFIKKERESTQKNALNHVQPYMIYIKEGRRWDEKKTCPVGRVFFWKNQNTPLIHLTSFIHSRGLIICLSDGSFSRT